MPKEAEICTAAFFRSKGKDVVTEKEFTMGISLDLRWMSVKEASALLRYLESEGCIKVGEGYVRPGKDYSGLQVPIAYRPSEDLRRAVSGVPAADAPRGPGKKTDTGDLFSVLVELAVKRDIPKSRFIGECNRTRQKLGVDVCTAALILLKDAGADVSELCEKVYRRASDL